MKRILYVLISLFVIASLALAGCQKAEEPEVEEPEVEEPEVEEPTEELAVGIVLPTKDEPRWIQDQTRFEDKLSGLGYDVEILFSQADPSQEKANVEALITKGAQVIILCPHDSAAAAASAEAAHDAGVAVISYDRLITDTDAVDYYVTFDSVAVGEAQAQYLVDKAEGTGNPLYLYAGAATDNNAFLFFEGGWNVLQPKIADGTFYIVNSDEAVALQDKAELTRDEMADIISQITTNWDFDDAKSLAEANLTSAGAEDKGDVFILAPNDGTARAIADAFGADTDVDRYVVSGQDAEIASVQYIIDGKQSMTVLKDVRMLVDDAVDTAVAVVEGKTVETTGEYDNGVTMVPAIQSEVITVDQSNLQEAIIDSGYWDASKFTGLDTMGQEAELGTEENPLIWALVPSGETENVLAGFDAVTDIIYDETGIVIESFVATEYVGVIEALAADPPKAHIASLATFAYLVAAERGVAEAELVAVRYGAPYYTGQIFVRADSGITSIEELAGTTFCRPDEYSTSGWIIPSITLRSVGIDPDADLTLVDAGSHDASVVGVYNGDCDAGSSYVDARSGVADEYPDVMDVLTVINESVEIPNDGVQYHPSVPRELRDEINGVLLRIDEIEGAVEALEQAYEWTELAEFGDDFYDPFRNVLSAAGVNIEDYLGE